MSDNTLGNLESTSRNVKEITEYDIDKVAGVETTEEVREKLEATKIEAGVLISYDQLVVNFLQQYEDAKEDLLKMQTVG